MGIIEIISAILGTGILTTIVTHFLTKRKYKTETDGTYLDNIEKALGLYEKLIASIEQQLNVLKQNQDKMLNENIVLKNELNTIKEQTTRLSSLLCTDLPCTKRVQDSSIIDCMYIKGSKRQARKLAKQQSKKKVEN